MYEFFDDIICINLDISQERRKQASLYFKQLGIPARFFTVQKHAKGGRYGCFDSHIQIIRHAYNNNYNNILVFEDDFLPTAAYSNELIQHSIDFMRSNNDWDIFYYGYGCYKIDNNMSISSIITGNQYSENIVQYNPYLTHCLCYSRRAMHKILQNYEKYIDYLHIDVCLGSYMNLNNYCMVPMLFDQIFDIDYNIEPASISEIINRNLYPFYAYSKLNYAISAMKYYFNILYADYTKFHYKQFMFFSILSVCICILIIIFAYKA